MKYFQCLLRKENKEQTAWIPEKYAKTGKVLRIGDDNGWTVLQIYSSGVDNKDIKIRSHLHKTHRKVSDI